MKFLKELNLKIYLVIFIGISLLFYQNCGSLNNPVSFSSKELFPDIIVSRGGGNGDGLDGKPRDGQWVRINPSICPGTTVQSLISINQNKPLIVSDNCVNKNFSFSLSDSSLHYEFYNPNYFIFAGAVFEIVSEDKKIPSITESFCRYKDSEKGIDVQVQVEGNSFLSAKIVKGMYSNYLVSSVNYPRVDKIVSKEETIVQSSDGSFQLNIHGSAQEHQDLQGTLVTHIENEIKSFPVICQKLSSEPVLKQDMTGLLAYWKFDDENLKDQSTAIDSKGSFPGTIFTSDTLNKSIAGVSGGGMNFDGLDDYIEMGNVLNMSTNSFSVSLWVKHLSTESARQVLGDRADMGGPDSGWNIMHSKLADDIFDARLSDGVNRVHSTYVTVPADPNVFSHIVAVYDRQNKVIKTYVNGLLKTTVDISAITGSASHSGPFSISCMNANKTACYRGQMDEVSVWSKVLTDNDVKEIFKNVKLF